MHGRQVLGSSALPGGNFGFFALKGTELQPSKQVRICWSILCLFVAANGFTGAMPSLSVGLLFLFSLLFLFFLLLFLLLFLFLFLLLLLSSSAPALLHGLLFRALRFRLAWWWS